MDLKGCWTICNLLFCTCFFSSDVLANKWSYLGTKGSQDWHLDSPSCGDSSQSPIDFNTSMVFPGPNLGLLKLVNYSQTLSGGTFINNGHAVQLNLPPNKSFKLAGAGMGGVYSALQLHFHWAGNNSNNAGSEHSVNGKYYEAEMHIVHIKDPYTNVEDIKDMPDGLAVIGVFLHAVSNADDNPEFQILLDTAQNCQHQGDSANLTTGPSLLSLLPKSASYYRYYGSLTTPPCYESVQWTVYQDPVIISSRQLKMFQSLKSSATPAVTKAVGDEGEDNHSDTNEEEIDDDLSDNYRPVQPLNNRVVTAYYDVDVSLEEEESNNVWHYEGKHSPENWNSSHQVCGGNLQSPINFVSKNIINVDSTGEKPQFSSSYHDATTGEFINNGHTVMYKINEDQKLKFMEGNRTFRALQVHFHWGEAQPYKSTMQPVGGSEHTVDGNHFPVEMHIVHSKETPGDGKDGDANTDDDDDALAVLGVFFNITSDDRSVSDKADDTLKKLTNLLNRVNYPDEEIPVNDGPVLFDLLPANKTFYRYMGSLTTPPCTQNVMWSVFTNPVVVSMERFLQFQSLYKVHPDQIIPLNNTKSFAGGLDQVPDGRSSKVIKEAFLVNNFRPTQAINSRFIVVHVDYVTVVEVPDSTLQIVLFVVLGLIVFCGLLILIVCCRNRPDKSAEYKKGHPVKGEATDSV